MNPERVCPHCRNPVPLLATECLFCRKPLGVNPPAEEPRYQVIRSGQPPVDAVPEEVRRLDEQSRVYYCKLGGQTVGPVTAADIRDAFGKGQIDGQASVGIQGRKEWYPIRALPQFSQLITGVGPVPQTRPPAMQTGAAAPPAPAPWPAPGPAGPGPRTDAGRASLPRPTPPPRPGIEGPDWGNAVAPMGLVPSAAARNDETLVVAPLPSPALLQIGASTGQVVDPQLALWQKEVRSWRRLAYLFGILAGGLLLLCAALIGLLTST